MNAPRDFYQATAFFGRDRAGFVCYGRTKSEALETARGLTKLSVRVTRRRASASQCVAADVAAGWIGRGPAPTRPGSVAASVACSCCPRGFDPATHCPASVRA